MDRMEAIQHDFLDARRRWKADQDGDFKRTAAYGELLRWLGTELHSEPEFPISRGTSGS